MDFVSKKIHMVGIGGIGMSALAFILSEMGCNITGSDIETNSIIERLRQKGAAIGIGHDGNHVKDQDIVVYSSSIKMNNAELLVANKKRIPIISRTELLKMVMERYKKIIAVTGTHGKTTITALTSHLLEKASLDPTVLIGGESPHFSGNAKLGKGDDVIVSEVDESDGRFVILRPTHIIVPNLEKEHFEHYNNEKHLVDTFRQFLKDQSPTCIFFYWFEDKNLRKLARWRGDKTFSFGFSRESDVCAENIKIEPSRGEFDCFYRKTRLGRFIMNVPGIHNILNALAVISLGIELKIDADKMKDALASYRSVKRRFEVIGDVNGAKVVEDYAHHPTEIKATILAACSLKPKRLITVFQPHRYTRTKYFYREFASSFAGSNEVILTEVYSAAEDEIEGATTKLIYDIMAKDNSIPVRLLAKEKIPAYIFKNAKNGDLILVLGAGDIGKVAHNLVKNEEKCTA